MVIVNKILQRTTLDFYLDSLYFSKKDIHLLKMEKRIRINSFTTVENCDLENGDIVEIDIHCEEQNNTPAIKSELDILYEDDACLIVNKPVGIIIHDDSTESPTLDNYISYYYNKTKQKHRVYHVHRLDKETSGAILYCKEKFLLACFERMLERKEIKRTYLAQVGGIIEKPITIHKKIGKDRHVSNKYRISETGKEAITHVIPIKEGKKSTLVECILETGRTHQIRVHLASIGHPIEGDTLYGGKVCNRMKLHSSHISFVHPVTKSLVNVDSEIVF